MHKITKTPHTVTVLAVFPKGSPVGQSGVLWSGVPGDWHLQLCDLHRHWVQGDSGLQERRLCIRFISLCLGPLDWGRDGQDGPGCCSILLGEGFR